uniref:Uncharacterized protein n=1 Tax=Octopus bimaculoides TaxID=37653 RepID=A0A0L8IFE5_OCTBM
MTDLDTSYSIALAMVQLLVTSALRCLKRSSLVGKTCILVIRYVSVQSILKSVALTNHLFGIDESIPVLELIQLTELLICKSISLR